MVSSALPPVNPVGPFSGYCDGYGQPGALGLGYVSTMKLATGVVDTSLLAQDSILEDIVVYDRAEKNNAYIGQINMGTASSFCGPMGLLWGYDIAIAPDLRADPLMEKRQYDGTPLPVFRAQGLLRATEALFGTSEARRFPPLPGAYVICAHKSQTARQGTRPDGSTVNAVWCYMAVSIASDRDTSADLFVEDAGCSAIDDQDELDAWLDRHIDTVAESIVLCGQDQNVSYQETFIGHASVIIPEGHVGTALACAPFITLAQDAVVGSIERMRSLSLSEWNRRAPAGLGTIACEPRETRLSQRPAG